MGQSNISTWVKIGSAPTPYDNDEDLDETVNELLSDIACDAEDRHCFSESDARMEGIDRHW